MLQRTYHFKISLKPIVKLSQLFLFNHEENMKKEIVGGKGGGGALLQSILSLHPLDLNLTIDIHQPD